MTGPGGPGRHRGRGGGPQVVGPAQGLHGVDEPGGHVDAEAPLAGAVVVGEGVVVVVPTLTQGQQGHKPAKEIR